MYRKRHYNDGITDTVPRKLQLVPESVLSPKKPSLSVWRKSRLHQLNQKTLQIRCLSSTHQFSTSANVLTSTCRKWDYLVCRRHDMAKHRQGLLKLWGRNETFKTVKSVICCLSTSKLSSESLSLQGIKHLLFSIRLSQWLSIILFFFLKGKIQWETANIMWRWQTWECQARCRPSLSHSMLLMLQRLWYIESVIIF